MAMRKGGASKAGGKRAAGKKRAYRKRATASGLASRVKKIEDNFKPEKKHIVITPGGETGFQFAQSATLAYNFPGGLAAIDITPQLQVGTTVTERIGNKVNPTGCMIDFAVQADSSCVNKFQYKVHIVRVPDNTFNASVSTMSQQLLERNPFSPSGTALDWHSRRDIEYMRTYQIMKTVSGYINPDSLVGEIGFSQRKIALRMPKNCKWCYNNTVNETTTDRFYAVAVADTGTVSLSNGAIIRMSIKWFYYDQ